MIEKVPFFELRNDAIVMHEVLLKKQRPTREEFKCAETTQGEEDKLWDLWNKCWNEDHTQRPEMEYVKSSLCFLESV